MSNTALRGYRHTALRIPALELRPRTASRSIAGAGEHNARLEWCESMLLPMEITRLFAPATCIRPGSNVTYAIVSVVGVNDARLSDTRHLF